MGAVLGHGIFKVRFRGRKVTKHFGRSAMAAAGHQDYATINAPHALQGLKWDHVRCMELTSCILQKAVLHAHA